MKKLYLLFIIFIIGCNGGNSVKPSPVIDPLWPQEKIVYGAHSTLEYMGWGEEEINKNIFNMKWLRMKISRNGFLWDRIEANKGIRNWEYTDLYVNALLQNGIEPLMVISNNSPSWANDSNIPELVPTDAIEFENWLNEFKDFTVELAERYKGVVTYYEIGNEPNIDVFWKPEPNCKQYSQWANMVSRTVKEINPEAKIAIGSITIPNKAWVVGQVTGKEFLQCIYMNGLFPEAVSLHPYANSGKPPTSPVQFGDNVFMDIKTIRAIMDKNKQQKVPIWITEMGYQVKWDVTEEKQAKYLSDMVKIMNDKMPYISMFIWFWQEDFIEDNTYTGYGLLRSNKTLRPVGEVFKALND